MFFLWTSLGMRLDRKVFRWFFIRSFIYHSKTPIFVEHPLASFMLVKRDVIRKVGFLSNQYFLYLADSDFAKRLNRARIPIVHMGNLGFLHPDSYSVKQRSRQAYDDLMMKGMIQYARDWSHLSILRFILLLDKIFSQTVKRAVRLKALS
jgi:GT2 family glycosyltransferase